MTRPIAAIPKPDRAATFTLLVGDTPALVAVTGVAVAAELLPRPVAVAGPEVAGRVPVMVEKFQA